MAGHSCDMLQISALARQYGIKVIEDAAHAIGGRYLNNPIGNCHYSDITIFSFHPVKIITTAEGGVATTNDPLLAKSMVMTCSHGITKKQTELNNPEEGGWFYEQHTLGFNYRMTDLQAALGNSQLNVLSSFISKRNEHALKYQQQLSETQIEIILPLENTLSAYHLLLVRLPKNSDRKSIFEKMRAAGIGVHVHYIPIHLQPYYQQLGFKKGDFPQAEAYYQSCLTLPLFPDLTPKEIDFICDTLKGLVN